MSRLTIALETGAALVVAGAVFAGTYKLVLPEDGGELARKEQQRVVELERDVREAIDCEKTVAASADACETGEPLAALDRHGKALFFAEQPRWREDGPEMRLTCMRDDDWRLLQIDYRGKGETAWKPLTKKPMLCTGCKGELAITARNPFLITSFVNSHVKDGSDAVHEAVMNTPETAKRICALDGVHTRVEGVDGVSQFNGGKTGWRDPSEKTLSYWDALEKRWVTRNAGELGNQWIANIRCGCPYR